MKRLGCLLIVALSMGCTSIQGVPDSGPPPNDSGPPPVDAGKDASDAGSDVQCPPCVVGQSTVGNCCVQ